MSRSACLRPLRAGSACSTRSVNITRPTRSLFLVAASASTPAISMASSCLKWARVPKRDEPDTSMTNMIVSSRSST